MRKVVMVEVPSVLSEMLVLKEKPPLNVVGDVHGRIAIIVVSRSPPLTRQTTSPICVCSYLHPTHIRKKVCEMLMCRSMWFDIEFSGRSKSLCRESLAQLNPCPKAIPTSLVHILFFVLTAGRYIILL